MYIIPASNSSLVKPRISKVIFPCVFVKRPSCGWNILWLRFILKEAGVKKHVIPGTHPGFHRWMSRPVDRGQSICQSLLTGQNSIWLLRWAFVFRYWLSSWYIRAIITLTKSKRPAISIHGFPFTRWRDIRFVHYANMRIILLSSPFQSSRMSWRPRKSL